MEAPGRVAGDGVGAAIEGTHYQDAQRPQFPFLAGQEAGQAAVGAGMEAAGGRMIRQAGAPGEAGEIRAQAQAVSGQQRGEVLMLQGQAGHGGRGFHHPHGPLPGQQGQKMIPQPQAEDHEGFISFSLKGPGPFLAFLDRVIGRGQALLSHLQIRGAEPGRPDLVIVGNGGRGQGGGQVRGHFLQNSQILCPETHLYLPRFI